MISKLSAFFLLLFLIVNFLSAQGQKKDLYLYFKVDSSKVIYKKYLKIGETKRLDKKIDRSATEHDIYMYSYLSDDGKRVLIYDLFASLDKNNYCVGDTSIFKKYKILPYKNLEKINGLISDQWNDKNFAYKRVFLVERIDKNQFKIIQVQLFFPFSSNGFRSREVGSKDLIIEP